MDCWGPQAEFARFGMDVVKLNLSQIEELGDLVGFPVKEFLVRNAEGKERWINEAQIQGALNAKYSVIDLVLPKHWQEHDICCIAYLLKGCIWIIHGVRKDNVYSQDNQHPDGRSLQLAAVHLEGLPRRSRLR